MIVALAGGVGGARLANGLAAILADDELLIVVNTGDDFTHLGLRICPDLDTVMYTLAGLGNAETGWGLAGETWNFLGALERLGGENWFRLGDRDLATHVLRTQRLAAGRTLSEVSATLCADLGVRHRVVPMSDQAVETVVHTDEGSLSFQHYFVRRRCEPRVRRIEFSGAGGAVPSPAFAAALADPRLEAIIICPSNPYLSIGPILSVQGVRDALGKLQVPIVAVSPLIGGKAVKGPAAKIMGELGVNPGAVEIARVYLDVIDGLVIDAQDRDRSGEISALGVRVCLSDTLMKSADDQRRLAGATRDFATRVVPRADRRGAQ